MICPTSAPCHRPRRVSWCIGACLALISVGLLGEGVAYGQAWSGVILDLPGTRTPTNDSGSDQLYPPDVTVDAAGNAITVWRRSGPDAVRAARYDAASGAWSDPIDLALVRPVLFPVVAGDDLGNVVAAWTTDNLRTMPFTSSGRDNLIQIARYSAASGTWAAAQTIARAGTEGQFGDVRMAGTDSGDVFLVWTRARPGWGEGTVQSARYAAASGTWSSPVNLSVTATATAPKIAVDDAGNAMAVWSTGASSQFARYTAATGTWTNATNFGPNDFGAGLLEIDGSGNAMVVGVASSKDPLGIVIDSFWTAIRYTPNSASWSAPVRVSPEGRRAWGSVDLTMDSGGNATFVFGFEETPATSSLNGIYAAHYTAANGMWAGVDLVRDAWSHTSPRITVDASGNLTAAWHVVNDFSPVKILAARRPAGGAWETPVIVRRKFNHWEYASLAPTLPVDQAGNVTLVWLHGDSPAAGASLESTQWLATGTGVPPTGPPGAPTNLGATVSGNTLRLTWSAPTTGAAPTGYALVARLSAGGPVIATVPMGPGTSFSATAPNGAFVLSVRASNASGTGPESTSVTVQVPQATPPPGPPSNLTATTTGSTVSFSWTPSSSGGAVASYVLVAGLTPAFTVPYAVVPIGPTPGFAVSGVAAGTYYVRVQSQNASGTSAASNEVAVTVAGATPVGVPTLHPPQVTGSTVALSWSAGAGDTPTHYTLMASVAPDGPPIQTVPLTGTAISFSNVPSGTYYLRLTATNAAGTSPSSPQVTLNVP